MITTRAIIAARQGVSAAARRSTRRSLASMIPRAAVSFIEDRRQGSTAPFTLQTTTSRFFSSPPNNNNNNPHQFFPGQDQQQGSALEEFGVDLTRVVREQLHNKKGGKLDPIIGRDEEIRRCLQILARRTKNNPVLIGQAGVGKTAIAQGLAQRIVSGQVPESMKGKRVVELDLTRIMSGAMFRGQFEQRLQQVLKEVQDAQGEIILFLDEIHTMVGAGKTEGSSDMGNILKPALARGDLQLVGATTLEEYKIMEKDAALARRFQPVLVHEPNLQDTLSILRGIKPHYELHHGGIRIRDEALMAAVTLSDRYINDRQQPDKSIDLIDEACSRLRLEQESKPEILWQVERDLLTKQIEQSALQQEDDDNNAKLAQRKQLVNQQVEQLQAQAQKLTELWQSEKDDLQQIKTVKEQLESARMEVEAARRSGDFAKAGELMHSTIPNLQHELERLEAQVDDEKRKKRRPKMLAEAVTADAVADIVSRHTGIPVSRMTGGETSRLLHMEDALNKRVVGQDHALKAVSNCVRLARTRLQAHDRTLGNFLFVGPTGVGKTELCKALAEFLFDNANAMTRIDMSEYSEKHTVSRLIGAPPGYVGYDEGGGLLTENVRRRPYQVLLLDEMEKAHPEVWNVLLPLLDDGHLTDSHGRKVDFRNVLVVMTSNMGASVIADLPSHLQGSEPEVHDMIMNVVRQTLSPELVNRIDETIVFNRLQRDHMHAIADIHVSQIAQRLQDVQNMTLDISAFAKDCLSERGFDIRYGARPLKRTLARDVLHPLSKLLLEGTVREGDTVRVRTRGEAEKEASSSLGWICSNPDSNDKNDVVIMKNHEPAAQEDDGDVDEQEMWEDFLLEEGDGGVHRLA